MTRLRPLALVTADGGFVALVNVVDTARQLHAGIADAGTVFAALASFIAVMAALALGRRPQQRRMSLLILWWLLMGVVSDFAGDWPSSRAAATVSWPALGLAAPAFAQMALAYPKGRVRDRLERAFLSLAYVISIAWAALPLLVADPRHCTACTPRTISYFFTGTCST